MTRAHAVFNASSAKVWMDCGIHTKLKLKHEAAGTMPDTSSIHTERGSALHDVTEEVLRHVLGQSEYDLGSVMEDAIGEAEHDHDYTVTDTDREQIEICVNACLNLTSLVPDGKYLLEQAVPLLHEPESTGKIDFAILSKATKTIVINDHKYGRGEVPPDSLQNQLYALALLARVKEKMGWEPDEVILSITQPALYREAVTKKITFDELRRTGMVAKQCVKDVQDGIYKPASTLATCDAFCPFTDECAARDELIRDILDIRPNGDGGVEVGLEPLTVAEVEAIVRASSSIDKIVRDCKQKVIQDPLNYPNWRRLEVANARKWDEVLDEETIAHRLRLEGCDDVYALRTPAKIKDQYPDAVGTVDELSIDAGHHIRLREGAPQEEKETAPAKRPAAKKKAAKKKAAKKSPAKKAARKRRSK